MTDSSSSPPVVAHATASAWGRGVMVEDQADKVRYFFEDGVARLFKRDDPRIRALDLPEAERAAIRDALLRRHAPPKAAKRGRATPRALATETLTFEAQEARFRARFPLGFEDPEYEKQERGTSSGKDRYKDAAISFAQEALSRGELEALLDASDGSEVFRRAVRALRLTLNLAYPKTEKPAFEAMAESAHLAFARALRDALHGEGDYAARFDRLVAAIAMESVPWTIATLFPALVHPTEHVFVKPTFSARQARILRMDEPPDRHPSGAGYAQHLAVASALRARLVDAGYRPRDLFDVYTFSWITQRESPRG